MCRSVGWPVAATVALPITLQFEAKAFQGPWDEEPVWKVYKVC